MAVLDPEELLQQAEWLVKPRQPGPPRQVDVRRAISAAYYALFHCVVTAVADEFAGKTNRGGRLHSVVYRSVDHRKIKTICEAIRVTKVNADIAILLPGNLAGNDLREFGAAMINLQTQRHAADYDPGRLFRTSHAIVAVSSARQALASFGLIIGEERRALSNVACFLPSRIAACRPPM